MTAKGFLTRAFSLTASSVIQNGLQAIIMLWLARTDQSGYGLFVLGAGVAAMVRAGLSLGFDQYTLREFSGNHQPRSPLLRRMTEIKSGLGAVILVCLVVFALLKGWNGLQTTVVAIMALGQVMESVSDTFFSLFRAEGRQVEEGFYCAVSNLVGALYAALCLVMGLGLIALAFFLVISSGLKLFTAAVGALRMGYAPSKYRIHSLLPRGQITAVATILGVSLMGSFYNHIQIFLLKQFHGLDEVALYGAAAGLAGGISGFVAHLIIGAVLFPSLAAAAVKDRREMANKIRIHLWRLITFGIGLAFLLSTFGGWILTTLYGNEFAASEAPLRILAPAVLLSLVNNFGVYVSLAMRKERPLLFFHFLPAFLSLGLGLLIIPRYGPVGAAVNLLICRTGMFFLIMGWLQNRFTPIRWFEGRRLLVASLAGGAVYLALFRVVPGIGVLSGLGVYSLVMGFDREGDVLSAGPNSSDAQ